MPTQGSIRCPLSPFTPGLARTVRARQTRIKQKARLNTAKVIRSVREEKRERKRATTAWIESATIGVPNLLLTLDRARGRRPSTDIAYSSLAVPRISVSSVPVTEAKAPKVVITPPTEPTRKVLTS